MGDWLLRRLKPHECCVITLLETQLARFARLWCRDRVRHMGRRRVVHLRPPSLLLNSLVRLLPGRNFRSSLSPMNQSGFITPLKQPSHCRPVGFRVHESLHRSLGRPTRAGPERVPAIPQHFDREIAFSVLSLPRNSQRLHHERREIRPRPNPQTRNGYDCHDFNYAREKWFSPRACHTRFSSLTFSIFL